MPTLIRLFLVLAFLAGLGFAGMIALTTMVDPGERDVTIRIPTRDLVPSTPSGGGGAGGVIDLDNLPDPVNVIARPSAEPAPEAEPAAEAGDVETIVAPGSE